MKALIKPLFVLNLPFVFLIIIMGTRSGKGFDFGVLI